MADGVGEGAGFDGCTGDVDGCCEGEVDGLRCVPSVERVSLLLVPDFRFVLLLFVRAEDDFL